MIKTLIDKLLGKPDKGVPQTVWAWLDLWHGKCRSGGIVDPERGATCQYVITAPYSRWREM